MDDSRCLPHQRTVIAIRPERKQDFDAIAEVVRLAFGRDQEARLVEALRAPSEFVPELSLVAIKDERIVGHILFSPITIQTAAGDLPALALAPVSVHPEFQNQATGSQLIREGLDHCRRLGHAVVVVIGHATYYPRFGFSSARAKGLEAPFPVPDLVFMALALA